MTTTATRSQPLLLLGGSTVTEHLGGEQTGGALALVEFQIEPGYPVPPAHVHEREDEMTYVIEGALEVTIGDSTRLLRAGEAIFKPRGIPHAFSIVGDQRARFLETIAPAGFERYFRAIARAIAETGALDRELAGRLMREHGVHAAPA